MSYGSTKQKKILNGILYLSGEDDMKIKPAGKILLLILSIGVAFGLWRGWQKFGDAILPSASGGNSVVPGKVDLPNPDANPGSGVVAYTAPGSAAGCSDKPEVRMLVWAWNAQMGLMLANGGPQATSGSQMCNNNVNLKLSRQDDVSKMQADMLAFATDLSQGNAQPKRGAHFVAIMGDGSAAFLKGVNDSLKRLGPEYVAKVVGSCGYSRGEDKLMGPPEWKANPAACRGGVIAGVLRDGDWNIAQKWLADNGLPTNPDEKTYDPDAVNWVSANDYLDAAEKYIAGYTESRPVVRHGKRTGETKQITVNSVVTWTPGDVNVAKKRGGLISIVSTKQYTYQMPCVLIGNNKWMQANRSTVEGMLQSVCAGGDQVKSNPEALKRASAISAAVYQDAGSGADYWERYYHGVTEPDKNGIPVELGGSSVNNLTDNLILFGMAAGTTNVFSKVYTVFGDLVVAQYPLLVPNYPAVNEIVDTSYLQGVLKKNGPITPEVVKATAMKGSTNAGGKVVATVSRKSWNIKFESGRASIKPESMQMLNRLLSDLVVAGGTAVEINGHTDNVGNPDANMKLSESRAFAVKQFLEKKAPVNFPEGRIRIFSHGQTQPLAPNADEAGRAKNRRVEIRLGATE